MLFLILIGVLILGMVCFAFWPRKQHMIDRDELEGPSELDQGGPT